MEELAMMKMTSAYANKLLRKLDEEKQFILSKEKDGITYRSTDVEQPVIPEYSFSETEKKLEELSEKVIKLKHAINQSNASNIISANGKQLTVDAVLIRMAQLNARKPMLDRMRKLPEKSRIGADVFLRKSNPEYEYINFDTKLVNEAYEKLTDEVMQLQMALDKYNQTIEFEVDI